MAVFFAGRDVSRNAAGLALVQTQSRPWQGEAAVTTKTNYSLIFLLFHVWKATIIGSGSLHSRTIYQMRLSLLKKLFHKHRCLSLYLSTSPSDLSYRKDVIPCVSQGEKRLPARRQNMAIVFITSLSKSVNISILAVTSEVTIKQKIDFSLA